MLFVMHTLWAQTVTLQQVGTQVFNPISDIANCGDGRFFVVEQLGYIYILNEDGSFVNTPFLNISTKVSTGSEQGLLGLAFHPNYKENGFFYVNYTNTAGDTRVVRFKASATNPNVADAASETLIYFIDQPYSNHNGGDLNFGPDGYLYVGTGDGGSAGDPGNRAQNKLNSLGKMLRLDVSSTSGVNNYVIPPTNPFVGSTAYLPEIWALGLRNPWRFSFDRLTGDMWIADVGQNSIEELNIQAASSTGGQNYGWRCYEGNSAYNTAGCAAQSTYAAPVFTYTHGTSECSVTGGYVYRGLLNTALAGGYLYADYCSGKMWMLKKNGTSYTNTLLGDFANYNIGTFGEDRYGEMYIGGQTDGKVYRLRTSTCTTLSVTGGVTNQTCAANGNVNITVANGITPITYTWSNGATTQDISNLLPGEYSVTVYTGGGCGMVKAYNVGYALAAPTNVRETTLTATSATIAWDAVAGATSYEVVGGRVGGTPQSFTTTNTSRSFGSTLIKPNKQYTWKVRAICGTVGGTSPFSASRTVTTPALREAEAVETLEVVLAPNPATSRVRVDFSLLVEGAVITVTDVHGKVYMQQPAQGSMAELDLSTVPSGMYLVGVQTPTSYSVQKLVKQ